MSLKLPRAPGEDMLRYVSSFEHTLQEVQPDSLTCGRHAARAPTHAIRRCQCHGSATAASLSPCRINEEEANVSPYMVMENTGCQRAALDLRLLGKELVDLRMHVARCLIFLPNGVSRLATIQAAVLTLR